MDKSKNEERRLMEIVIVLLKQSLLAWACVAGAMVWRFFHMPGVDVPTNVQLAVLAIITIFAGFSAMKFVVDEQAPPVVQSEWMKNIQTSPVLFISLIIAWAIFFALTH